MFLLFLLHYILTLQIYTWWYSRKQKWFWAFFHFFFFKAFMCWLKFKKWPQILNFIVKSSWYTAFLSFYVQLEIVSITPYWIFMTALLCSSEGTLTEFLLLYIKAWRKNEQYSKESLRRPGFCWLIIFFTVDPLATH